MRASIWLISLLKWLLTTSAAEAQQLPLVRKDVLILSSTKSYAAALRVAHQAAVRLRSPLDLEGYRPHPQSGLTWSRKDCGDIGFEYPAYVARGYGMVPDSAFVSIEYSDGYSGFAKRYYLVVAAVGRSGSPVVRRAAQAARAWYPEAYAKTTEVYIGCMH